MVNTSADIVPLVGLPADTFPHGLHIFHGIGDKYVRAVAVAAGAAPVMIPSLGTLLKLPELVSRFDGVVVTGAVSNVHPTHYGAAPTPATEPHDEARDATSLDVIRTALEMGVPLFAICRGIQELNVALGGTLQAEVHDQPGKMDHREVEHDEMDVRYGPQHKIMLAPGGQLARILDTNEIEVNSLHRQAIARLSPRLQVEATAPDGTIEAVSVRGAETFAIGVQWHPEYKVMDSLDSRKLFAAFGDAARAFAARRTTSGARLAEAASA
ncbi:MAG: gamma-glutamyl-gamma-aminobutyrate hydrolase family protein [Hyphomicrobiales bacterium]